MRTRGTVVVSGVCLSYGEGVGVVSVIDICLRENVCLKR